MIAVTGATGSVGGAVAQLLAAKGEPVRLLARDPARLLSPPGTEAAPACAYGDGESMRRALDGTQTVFFVSAGEAADRVKTHQTVVTAAEAAGVERVVYLSFLNAAADSTFTFARDHFHTEQALEASGLRFCAMRDSWYQAVLPLMVGEDGAIRGPAGDGRVSAVAPDDIVASAVALLTDAGTEHDGRRYAITGPEALTLDEVAAALTPALGREVRYERETVQEAYASRAGHDVPRFEVDGWVSTYTAIAAGELDTVSDDVERLTGEAPMRFADWLALREPE